MPPSPGPILNALVAVVSEPNRSGPDNEGGGMEASTPILKVLRVMEEVHGEIVAGER